MSARQTFPNFRVEACKNFVNANTLTAHFEFGNSAEKHQIKTSRQCEVMRPKEKTFLKVRDSCLRSLLMQTHRENLSIWEISVHSADRHAMSV